MPGTEGIVTFNKSIYCDIFKFFISSIKDFVSFACVIFKLLKRSFIIFSSVSFILSIIVSILRGSDLVRFFSLVVKYTLYFFPSFLIFIIFSVFCV